MKGEDLVKGFGEIREQYLDEMLRQKKSIQNSPLPEKGGFQMAGKVFAGTGLGLAAAGFIAAVIMGNHGRYGNTPSLLPFGTESPAFATEQESRGAEDTIAAEQESMGAEDTTAAEQESTGAENTIAAERESTGAEDTTVAEFLPGEEPGAKGQENSGIQSVPEETADGLQDRLSVCTVTAADGGIEIIGADGSLIKRIDSAKVVLDTFPLAETVHPLARWDEAKARGIVDGMKYDWFLMGVGDNNRYLEGSVEWQIGEPLPIILTDESLPPYTMRDACGTWDIASGSWLTEPEGHPFMHRMGHGLWTDYEAAAFAASSLMRMDGTVLYTAPEGQSAHIEQFVNYIKVSENVHVPDSAVLLFDLDGNLLVRDAKHRVLDVLPDAYVADDGYSTPVTLYDFEGNPVLTEESGLVYNGYADGCLNWVDKNGSCLATDLSLNILMTEAEFYDINPQCSPEQWLSENSGGQVTFQICDAAADYYTVLLYDLTSKQSLYAFCDRDFHAGSTSLHVREPVAAFDENFLELTSRDGRVKALDAEGNEVLYLDSAAVVLEGQGSRIGRHTLQLWNLERDGEKIIHGQEYLEGTMRWNRADPIPLVIKEEGGPAFERTEEAEDAAFTVSDFSGSCGIWDAVREEWIISPEGHPYLRLIGNGLWTDCTEGIHASGSLMRLNGEILYTSPENCSVDIAEHATWISVREYPEGGDGQSWLTKLFDLEGSLLAEIPSESVDRQVVDVLDDGFVMVLSSEADPDFRMTVLCDFEGLQRDAELSGLIYNGHCENYLNWKGKGDGFTGLITDKRLQPVITEVDFFAQNQDYAAQIPQEERQVDFQVCAVMDDTVTLMLSGPLIGERCIACDRALKPKTPALSSAEGSLSIYGPQA